MNGRKFQLGPGKQTAKTWFGLENQKENQPNYQRLLSLTVLPLNYFMVLRLERHDKFWIIFCMDEGTFKTPIPKCRLQWSFLFGVGKQFCRFLISETECKTPAEYGLKHNSTLPPPPCIGYYFIQGSLESGYTVHYMYNDHLFTNLCHQYRKQIRRSD